ncbi:hypothetical protein A2291_07060 [candidate division WOR-1 bacterium RIFOXYB2_FULL_42_35]|uniref:Peptidase M20 dimerisation domain-containing protein n=1 Tax=candidate division WOR-1 bacterium RIFOXYC2_FULL_41_25 TaxID=1802586 RepID=A0A1F4TKF2_UNCSA|nr:MAG: hypothetical protein A2247_04400 [candidate division WOR-1 bacterium RIFOXYA2_FULL_41_14]OGC22467.1 MAG: hypothetical protein A2291_07060 [candidate division WOR-1 bacterium RIFOXYB2_FULL_42_35]OGC33205.1 MAG: hypothetical protein A2462_07235 [candidate division WOR-1 bacterium RIFOXYC2_FULL_41_25]OGC41918.1 MAG: hypothetical protein A2548_03875 [candidate division WOR-1 bacterium RIFOXYD2_FULL_41_8]
MLNKNRLLKRFLAYVKIASHSGEEQAFAAQVTKDLKQLGLKPSQDKIGNIFVQIKGSVPGTHEILLNAHLDTVSPGKNIKPVVKKGAVFSNGKTILGADNKAGVAAIMEALCVLKENKLPHGDILVLFTIQEETGLLGSRQLDHRKIKARYGFVFDGGSPQLIHNAAPSQKNIEAWVHGKAAHAGVHPDKGISAIKVAAEAITRMNLGRIDRETTANIGIIQGGKATNIIPDKVYLKGEARSRTPHKLTKQLKHMVECLQAAAKKQKAKVKIKIETIYPAFHIPAADPILKIVTRAVNKLGLKEVVKASGGGSDANIFNQHGVKSLILGVGAHNLHGVKEKLVIKEFIQGTGLILELIKLCSKKP